MSTHTDVPVAQLVAPVWQPFVGAQATPAVQEAQTPALQTRFVPQAVPSGRRPVSTHVAVPDVHETAAAWQGSAATQDVPHELERKSQDAVTEPLEPQSMV